MSPLFSKAPCQRKFPHKREVPNAPLSIDPLSVQVDMNMPPLPDAAILLTDAVKERVAPVQGGEGGTVMVSEGLKPGDKVLMLRVQRGQQYIILSRISEKTGL